MSVKRTKVSGGKFPILCSPLILLGCFVGFAGGAAQGQLASASSAAKSPAPSNQTQARDVVTEEELKKLAKEGATLSTLLARSTPQTPVEARPSMESSLYRKSVILYDGEKHTVVPIGSVLHLPARYRNRVVEKPVGPFTFWPSFLTRNAAWLGAWEVPLRMAEGDADAASKVLAATAKEDRVLVAVYRGGPITILEPVPESSAGTKGNSGGNSKPNPGMKP